MTEHLPECEVAEARATATLWGVPADAHLSNPPRCICERLRACEQRIKTHEGCADAERIEGYEEGYDAAIAECISLGHRRIDRHYKRNQMTEHLSECPWFPRTHEEVTCRDAETLVTICEVIAKVREETLNAAVQRIEALPWTIETWNAHAERAAIIAAIRGD